MNGQRTAESGFTLIEVLVAMTILSIGLLGIAGMQVTAIRTNSSANTLTANSAIASGILEEILIWPTSTPVIDANWDFDPNPSVTQNTIVIDGGGSYTATYTVTVNYDAGPGSITNLTRIEVNVDQVGGNQRRITLVGFKRDV
ncbi:MAG: type IV pilus modification protein PilV [Desulfuromonadales bacterium]|nr:type IV pilus modification protein PilV [Desulfuromonadales bacterium]